MLAENKYRVNDSGEECCPHGMLEENKHHVTLYPRPLFYCIAALTCLHAGVHLFIGNAKGVTGL